jgi:hypothetical protein
MAVDAYHHTSLELTLEGSDRASGAHHVGDVASLLSKVVQLENIRIRLAAIRTRLGLQIVRDECASGLAPHLSRQADLMSVNVGTRSKICSEAVTAPPLVTRPMTVEAAQR